MKKTEFPSEQINILDEQPPIEDIRFVSRQTEDQDADMLEKQRQKVLMELWPYDGTD